METDQTSGKVVGEMVKILQGMMELTRGASPGSDGELMVEMELKTAVAAVMMQTMMIAVEEITCNEDVYKDGDYESRMLVMELIYWCR